MRVPSSHSSRRLYISPFFSAPRSSPHCSRCSTQIEGAHERPFAAHARPIPSGYRSRVAIRKGISTAAQKGSAPQRCSLTAAGMQKEEALARV